mgnify:CR=1 FL=1
MRVDKNRENSGEKRRKIFLTGIGMGMPEMLTARAKEVIDQAGQEIAVLIGSEGGFDESEVVKAKEKGCQVLSLGKRILRCETAPLAALSIIMFETGNMQ